MKFRTRWLFAAVALLSTIFTLLPSQNEKETIKQSAHSGIDTVEHHLEIELHAQLLARRRQPDSHLAEFTTDGCSGGLSVGWEYLAGAIPQFQKIHGRLPAWESCCITHDQAYHTGGPADATAEKSYEARREADLALKNCVLATGVKRGPELMKEYGISETEVKQIYDMIAQLMYRSVRIGGVPCSHLPWRWGYGWPDCHQ